MTERIYLGRHSDFGPLYLSQHSWDCEWYWGFGYVGNKSCHLHIKSLIDHPGPYDENWHKVDHQFEETWITQDQWWIIRDLFIQAYAIRKAADSMLRGGHQTENAKPHRIHSKRLNDELNTCLEMLLNNVWTLLNEWKRQRDESPVETVVGETGMGDT